MMPTKRVYYAEDGTITGSDNCAEPQIDRPYITVSMDQHINPLLQRVDPITKMIVETAEE